LAPAEIEYLFQLLLISSGCKTITCEMVKKIESKVFIANNIT
jgi:hypothetical protein